MQPSMHTPTQSMLRRPAASAAVIACAASATSDSTCKTVSLGGRPHIATSRQELSQEFFRQIFEWNLRRGFHSEQNEKAAQPIFPIAESGPVPGTPASHPRL